MRSICERDQYEGRVVRNHLVRISTHSNGARCLKLVAEVPADAEWLIGVSRYGLAAPAELGKGQRKTPFGQH
jgi:hypothetical protein